MRASEAGTKRLSPGFAPSSGWSSRLPARPCLSCSDLWWSMASVCRSERTALNAVTTRHGLPTPLKDVWLLIIKTLTGLARKTKATVWKPQDGEGPSPWNPRRELVPGAGTWQEQARGCLAKRAEGEGGCGSSRAGQAAGTQACCSGELQGRVRSGAGVLSP